ncbi:Hypothetical protein FKW44_017779 [Caligus rogercresseyi]|uniref:Uncharacterized protein n=1 Tax=Caligus rogercresseyi TaxID=217165 RepID=A0A7T8JW63_CALRO|nr:Hypothetical protein FKW44_017779 [Caligus rogercresseyi]
MTCRTPRREGGRRRREGGTPMREKRRVIAITIAHNLEQKSYNISPLWTKIFIDWRDNDGKSLKGFTPKMSDYKRLFNALN